MTIAGGTQPDRAAGRRRRPALAWVAAALLLVLVAALLGAGWYYSDQIEQDLLTPSDDPPEYDIRVIEAMDERVVLERTDDSVLEGVWGLEWADGYGQVAEIVRTTPDAVERRFRALRGMLQAGDRVRLRSFAFPTDPEQGLGLAFRHVEYGSDLGRMPAWLVEGTDPTWVIFVHGRNVTREEALRVLPTAADLDHPALVITYRNDDEAPASRDGRYRFGVTEWRDLEGAVRFALEQGAEDVVLFGYSTGGAIVTWFLQRSALADRVRGAIFDAPLLDVGAAVEQEADNRGLPRFLPSLGMVLSSLRFGVDWDRLDRREEAANLDVPILLIHGTDDDTVPIELSDELAASAGGNVTFLRVPGAGHVRSWNADPVAYEAAVRDFLTELAP